MLNISDKPICECNQDDKEITFSTLFGKSEQMLKDEFYVYQIQKLFLRVSSLVQGNLERAEVCAEREELSGLEVYSYAISPYFLKDVKVDKKKQKQKTTKKEELLIDFPSGEGSIKARQAEIKTAIKNKLGGVIVTLPSNADLYASCTIKKKLTKLIKKFKGEKSFVINDRLDEECLKKICRAIDGVNGKIVINCLGDSVLSTIDRVNRLKRYVGEEKIKVIAKIVKAEELMSLLFTGVLAVYTPCLRELLGSFEEKFNVCVVKV